MRVRIPILCAAVGLLVAANAAGGNLVVTERIAQELPLEIGGSFWIDNPVGDIEIVGSDKSGASVSAVKTTIAADRASLKEGSEQTAISFEGDRSVRLIRTLLPAVRTSDWSSSVSYIVRVPRTVHVRVAAKYAKNIHIIGISGNVTVRSYTGVITLDAVTGASIVDITNGKVVYHYTQKPMTNAQIQAVNADIEVNIPPDSNLNWIADTLRGDVLTNLPIRAEFQGTAFRGTINAPGGPTVTTQTLVGNVRLLGNGLNPRNLRSLREVAVAELQPLRQRVLLAAPSRRIQLPIAGGAFEFATSVGDVSVGEIRGWARIQTGAGEIELGLVYGDCNVRSLGGPLDLGDIMGVLTASTAAGDVQVRSAREGGHISTAGGMIRLLYAGGPTTLESGGGDIVVRQAAGPINADTKSGDITITADPNQKTQRIQAHTAQGNIILNVHPRFAADIDATVVTADPQTNAIYSDFKGLQIQRERAGSKTRIHATGKLNGGGERIELYAEDGDIHITTMTINPVTVVPPLP